MHNLKDMILKAPEGQLAQSGKDIINKHWGSDPSALDILRLLDHCVNVAAGSSFVIKVLDIMLSQAIANEQTTMEQLAKQATWRKDF